MKTFTLVLMIVASFVAARYYQALTERLDQQRNSGRTAHPGRVLVESCDTHIAWLQAQQRCTYAHRALVRLWRA